MSSKSNFFYMDYVFALLIASLAMFPAYGKEDLSQDVVSYTVRQGETLSSLSQRYLIPPPDLDHIQQINALSDKGKLKEGQVLKLPRNALRYSQSQAKVMQVQCKSSILSNGKVIRPGDLVSEGDVLAIPDPCSVSLALEDGSTIRVPNGGRLQITMLRNNPLDRAPVIRMQIAGGQVEVNVNERVNRTAPFEISTPTIVMGVRGTEFRVGHSASGETSRVEVLSGKVALTNGPSAQIGERMVPAGRGLVMDGSGSVQADEALLPKPTVSIGEVTNNHWRVRFDSADAVATHLVRQSTQASFVESTVPRAESGTQAWIHRPGRAASFLEVTPESASGLRGRSTQVGLCESSNGTCDIWFLSPFSKETPVQITVRRINGDRSVSVVIKPNMKASQGNFLIRGLPAGEYEWEIVQANQQGEPLNYAARLQRGGSFLLIANQAPQ